MHNHNAIAIIFPIVPMDIKSTSLLIHIIIIILTIIYHFPLVEKLMTKQWENRDE
jgi:hypothetical protein